VPPLTGMLAASWALLSALQVATSAARAMARTTAGPIRPAATPMLTNTPVPTMEPRPIMVAPNTPTSRFSAPPVISVTVFGFEEPA
jgi:hypothetical protein